jgi:hypothetical protein
MVDEGGAASEFAERTLRHDAPAEHVVSPGGRATHFLAELFRPKSFPTKTVNEEHAILQNRQQIFAYIRKRPLDASPQSQFLVLASGRDVVVLDKFRLVQNALAGRESRRRQAQ